MTLRHYIRYYAILLLFDVVTNISILRIHLLPIRRTIH